MTVLKRKTTEQRQLWKGRIRKMSNLNNKHLKQDNSENEHLKRDNVKQDISEEGKL